MKKLSDLMRDGNIQKAILLGIVLLVVLFGLTFVNWLEPFEVFLLDMRFRLRGQQEFPQNIAIIAIDEASLDKLGRWPWSRDKHGHLIRLLKHASFRPAVLSFDVLFENRDLAFPEGDQFLMEQLQNFENELLLAYFFESGMVSLVEKFGEKEKRLEAFALAPIDEGPPNLPKSDKVSLPFLELARASNLGFVNNPPEVNGRTHYVQMLMEYQGNIYPSFGLLTALKYLGVKLKDVQVEKTKIIIPANDGNPYVIPITSDGRMLVNYYGTSRLIPTYSFLQVLQAGKAWLEGEEVPELLRSFKGKILFVGATALGLQDRRVTPYYEYEPAVSVQAQGVANILEQNFLKRPPPYVAYLIFFMVGLVAIFISGLLGVTYSLFVVIGLGIFYFISAYVCFLQNYWLEIANIEVAIAILFIGVTSFRYFLTSEELKRTQEQLLQSEKMASIGMLSASTAHEYKNILAGITLSVTACQRPNIPPEMLVKFLGTIKTAVDKANQISKSLLTFARKTEFVKKPGNLKKTIEDMLLLLEKDMMKHKVIVKREFADIPTIGYDEGQISQVFMNMMQNARDALKECDRERHIIVRLVEEGKFVLLEIEDNGMGIPKKIMKNLFQPFMTSKKAGEGTGLGLPVCHGIIQNHGGDITVKTAQDKGTTWHITLPKL